MKIIAQVFSFFILGVLLDCAYAQDIAASKLSDSSLSFATDNKNFVCNTKFKFRNFRYSNDHQFLIFYFLDSDFKNPIKSGSVEVLTAYKSCMSGLKITIKPAPKYESIIDINKKSNILVTNLFYLYKTGGDTIDGKWLSSVWKYDTSKPIIFPFSPLRTESKYIYRSEANSKLQDKAFDSPAPVELLQSNPASKVNIISAGGKYVAPVGATCEPFSGDIWNVETKQRVSFEGLDSNALTAKCKEMFR